ncbi:MAG: Rne/Rng family ribonuclease [Arachnia sp.]
MSEQTDPTQPEAAPRKRRRAASRPAGPPVEAPSPAPEALTAPAEPSTDPAAAAAAPAEKAPPKRRRATRASKPTEPAAEAASAPTPEESAPAPEALLPEVAAEEAPATPTPEETAPSKPARKRRTTKKAAEAAPEKAEPSQAVADEAPAATETGADAAPAEPEPVEAEADAAADADELDGIAAALAAAEREALARRRPLADPFAVTADGQSAELVALAGAIASDGSEVDDAAAESAADDAAEDTPSQPSGEPDGAEEGEESEESKPNRRRRRRGGRRRRRGRAEGSDDDSGDDAEESTEASEADEASDDSDSSDDGDAAEGEATTRRRRRRRRRGESDSEESSSEVTGIEGSTRMAAKRQRRKESRAAGRRRAPILSEAEFLARRESVKREMVIRQREDYTQLAVIEDDILVEHYVDRASATSLIGNIYLGRIQNVRPSMEAAFIDIGRGRNAVLYSGEVDWDGFGVSAEDRKVEKVFKSGQSVLVQVTKDPVGQKGARLTGHISLPGRYIVYSPGGHLSGVSRKLPDTERSRLKGILGGLITDEESVIVRTAAEGVSSEELVRDVNRLKAQWEVIEKKVKQGKAPAMLYSEPDATLRIVRDLFTEDFRRLVVQGDEGSSDAYDAISAYVGHVAPHLADRIERFTVGEGEPDAFAKYRIDEQVAKALDRKVYLPSGGSLVIDRTEAMTVVDVNTGRFTGAGGNLEATVASNNLEAAEEIVRQLRLRDLGGIIVIDFIDMVLPSNRELLMRRLVECLGRDRTRHQVAEVTSLGLVQLTRKRIGTGLQEAFTEECEHCHGSGYTRFDEPVESQAPSDGGERRSKRRRGGKGSGKSDQ